MKSEDERIYYIALGQIQGIGVANAKQLISYCGGVKPIFTKKKHQLLKIPGVGPYIVNAIKKANQSAILKRAEKELKFCEENQIEIFSYHDPEYPKRLNHCKDAPYIIYVLGDADLNVNRMINIVGTRRATNYGKNAVEQIIEQLQDYNVTIVSGLAYGIDAYAHKNALDFNLPTIGVLAHGLDTIYPAAHRALAQKIVRENGALISEFKSETKPDKQNFPSRNRIVAGMCDATVVIESAEKGGALITADIALSYHRDVFALPGKANDKYSKGCNALIKNNRAALIESGSDIVRMLGWEYEIKKKDKGYNQRSLFVELEGNEQKIYDYFVATNTSIHIDALHGATKLPNSKLLSSLLNLELKGIVCSKPGNRYELV